MRFFGCCLGGSDHRPPPEAIRPVGGVAPGRSKTRHRARRSFAAEAERPHGDYMDKRRRKGYRHSHERRRKRSGHLHDGRSRMHYPGDDVNGKRLDSSQGDNSREAYYSGEFGRTSLSHGSHLVGKSSLHTGGNRIIPSSLPPRGGALNDRTLGRGLSASAPDGAHDNNGLSRSANFMKVEKWLHESSKHEQNNIHPKQIVNLSEVLGTFPDIVEPPSERDRLRIPTPSLSSRRY